MSTVLLTWELGDGMGHLHPLGTIASVLKRRGHKVIAAVRDIRTAEKHLAQKGIEFVQAPIFQGVIKQLRPSAINYAELLIRSGYLDSNQVAGQIRSWLNLMKLIKPDLVLADHSPSVLLATKIANISTATVGTGFYSPPVETPMPSMMMNTHIPSEKLIASENMVLEYINESLRMCQATPLDEIAGIFASIDNYFLTLPETDHYGARNNTRYWGLIHSSTNETAPVWPSGDGPKVFIYIRNNSKPYQVILENLKQLGWPSLIISQDAFRHDIKLSDAPNLAFSNKLFNLETVGKLADIVVTNGNHGTTVKMLQLGCRVLIIPIHMEHSMLANRITRQGLGVAGNSNRPCYRSLLEKTNDDLTLKNNLKLFSSIYGKLNPQKQLIELVNDIEMKFLRTTT